MRDNIIENLELIEPHQAFFILKNCLSIPKLIYILRSAPCFKCKEELEVFDTAIKTNMEKIFNVSFGEENWSQASLPIRHAGLGLCSAQTYPYHVSCHRLMPVKASSTVYFPLSTWKPLMWM